MNQSFTTLWNITFAFTGPVWAVLAWMIWSSGQLRTPQDHTLFLAIVIPGFTLIYLSGFLIRNRHAKKMQGGAS
ncbi:MAG: hypothetical protein HGB04_05575 [Chlorobiaceae bacterium]|nr:hypothetical protein [Chlorobiaceae bacterium]